MLPPIKVSTWPLAGAAGVFNCPTDTPLETTLLAAPELSL